MRAYLLLNKVNFVISYIYALQQLPLKTYSITPEIVYPRIYTLKVVVLRLLKSRKSKSSLNSFSICIKNGLQLTSINSHKGFVGLLGPPTINFKYLSSASRSISRSSHSEVFNKITTLKRFAKLPEKHQWWRSY